MPYSSKNIWGFERLILKIWDPYWILKISIISSWLLKISNWSNFLLKINPFRPPIYGGCQQFIPFTHRVFDYHVYSQHFLVLGGCEKCFACTASFFGGPPAAWVFSSFALLLEFHILPLDSSEEDTCNFWMDLPTWCGTYSQFTLLEKQHIWIV